MRNFQKQLMLTASITLLTLLFSPLTLAKMINLYDQPKADAKVLGTVDSDKGMVPIFTPTDSEWMKVGDPKNGNVGWIKVADLSNESGGLATQLSVTQRTVNSSTGPKTYQVVQFNTPKPMSSDENQALIKQYQARQQEMQKAMQNFYKQMGALYQSNPVVFMNSAYPMMMPIIVVPAPGIESAAPAQPAKAKDTTKS